MHLLAVVTTLVACCVAWLRVLRREPPLPPGVRRPSLAAGAHRLWGHWPMIKTLHLQHQWLRACVDTHGGVFAIWLPGFGRRCVLADGAASRAALATFSKPRSACTRLALRVVVC